MTVERHPRERFLPNPKLKLREQLGEVMRFKHFSHRTESAYWCWIRGFILFHQKRHPREMGAPEVQAYLSHLATERDVAPATQNQALNALVFLYREVLDVELGGIGRIERPTRRAKLPTVLTKDEVKRVLAAVPGAHGLVAQVEPLRVGRVTPCAPLADPETRVGSGTLVGNRRRAEDCPPYQRRSAGTRCPARCGGIICMRRGPTSGRCRSCSATRM